MEKEKRKLGFCESGKCACLGFIILAGAIAAVVCVTFLVKDLRDVYEHGETDKGSLKWWQTSIIYQIYPRSFQDSNGDGIGDLQGIISRLEYFNYINVGAIWLSPIFQSPMRDFGYDISNYTAVDTMFGTMADFDELVKKAKSLGIKVIIDFVPNHTSNESTWFQQSRNAKTKDDPYSDFYIWNEGKTVNGVRKPPNNWQSVFEGSAWTYDSVRGAYYYHAFLDSQPDLNYRNPKVLEKMEEVIRFWMDKGVDGLRIDAIPHLFELSNTSVNEPPGATNGIDSSLHKYTKNQPEIFDVVRRWKAVIEKYDDRFLLAETFGIPHDARLKYYEAGAVPFYFGLITAKTRCQATIACFQQLIEEGMNVSAGWPNFVLGNHDNKRIADSIGEQYTDALNLMLLTLPGTPTTYYGEELGMKGGDYTGMTPQDPYAITSNNTANSRDPERNPMQWNTSSNAGFTTAEKPWLLITKNTDYMNVNVEVMKQSNTSSLNLYKRLAELRQHPAFQNAEMEFLDTGNKLLMYKRSDGQTSFLVAINLQTVSINLQLTNAIKGTQVFSTKTTVVQNIALQSIVLASCEGIIIRLDD